MRAYSVGSVGSHASSEDNAALASQLDEHARRGGSAVPRSVHVQLKQPLDLVQGEVQRGLVLGGTGIGDHAVEAALLLDDGIERSGHALLLGDVAVLELETAGEALQEGLEVLAGLGDVQAEDGGGVVGEADLCDTETNALVGTGDWILKSANRFLGLCGFTTRRTYWQ